MFAPPRTTTEADLHAFHRAVLAVRPDLETARARWVETGWDNDVLILDERWVFRRPVSAASATRLRNEPVALNLVRRRLRISVPQMVLHEAPMLFSEHEMIPGETLEGTRYRALPNAAREALADDLATAYAQTHAISIDEALGGGARHKPAWPDPQTLERCVLMRLADIENVTADAAVKRIVAAYARADLSADTMIFGQFDAHGWNMALDPCHNRLTGLFDFAAAGVGPLHHDLCFPAFVDDALMVAVVRRYNAKTGRCARPDRARAAYAVVRCLEFLEARPPLGHYVAALQAAANVAPN